MKPCWKDFAEDFVCQIGLVICVALFLLPFISRGLFSFNFFVVGLVGLSFGLILTRPFLKQFLISVCDMLEVIKN